MRKEEIPQLARRCLSDLLEKSGSILYSSHETLKPGDVYLLGFNPGGEGGAPILESIEGMLHNCSNAYLDECWDNKRASYAKGEAPLQKKICWLLCALGLSPREICASNLIFVQSVSAKHTSYELAQHCWPIHDAILSLVRPKLIIAFGNSDVSPYGYLRNTFGGHEECRPSGHGSWSAKGFDTNISGNPIYVAGIPHMSRYDPRGRNHIVEWLRSKLAA